MSDSVREENLELIAKEKNAAEARHEILLRDYGLRLMRAILKALVKALPLDFQQEFRPSATHSGFKVYGTLEGIARLPPKGKGKMVGLIEENSALQGSSLDISTLDELVEKYHLEGENVMVPRASYIPYRNWRRDGEEFVAVYIAHFECGLRFPLHPFIQEILEHYQLGISQLTPPSYRYLCSFVMICQMRSILPSTSLFKEMFNFYLSQGIYYTVSLREG